MSLSLSLLAFASPSEAAGVVGNGAAASCTASAFTAALSGGGSVTFNCGPSPVVITLPAQAVVSQDTVVNGGGLITISGGNNVRVFRHLSGDLSLLNLRIMEGRGDYGGCVLSEGLLRLTDVIVDSCRATIDGAAIYSTGSAGGIQIIGHPEHDRERQLRR